MGEEASRQPQIKKQDGHTFPAPPPPMYTLYTICLFLCIPPLPSPLSRERKFSASEVKAMITPSIVCTVGGVRGNLTSSLGTNSQRPVEIAFGHCPNWKEHFFPRSLLRISYNHTLFSHIQTYTPKEKNSSLSIGS